MDQNLIRVLLDGNKNSSFRIPFHISEWVVSNTVVCRCERNVYQSINSNFINTKCH